MLYSVPQNVVQSLHVSLVRVYLCHGGSLRY